MDQRTRNKNRKNDSGEHDFHDEYALAIDGVVYRYASDALVEYLRVWGYLSFGHDLLQQKLQEILWERYSILFAMHTSKSLDVDCTGIVTATW